MSEHARDVLHSVCGAHGEERIKGNLTEREHQQPLGDKQARREVVGLTFVEPILAKADPPRTRCTCLWPRPKALESDSGGNRVDWDGGEGGFGHMLVREKHSVSPRYVLARVLPRPRGTV